MSRLVLNEYNMFSDKIKNERDIYGISDVHSDSEKLYQVKELLQELFKCCRGRSTYDNYSNKRLGHKLFRS